MDEKLLKPYEHKETEARIYKTWEESGFFNPEKMVEAGLTSPDAKPFTIVMPPPNANGNLHAGHALFITLEDTFTRYKRMQGFKALWIPGADHAGFETQVVYEKKLEKEGRSRFGMDKNDLYKEIYDFTIENKKNMEQQIRQLGSSCDWSREKFTLDPDIVEKTQNTFVKMYNDGLVYRGKRTINWCSKHQTSLSDVETENAEETSKFYYLKYGPFTIATARPETKFGDKYVVMHPDDTRYAEYKHGDTFSLEWINGPITATVIKDESIDMEFGTGVMTITPWHSQIDFEIAKRHNLDMEQIIDWNGKLLPIAGDLAGIKILEAREKIIEKLSAKGLVEKIDENYKHIVKRCYKCSTLIEPQIKDQWFVKMEPLGKMALESVDRKEVRFIPDNYEKIFRYWMENTMDWNISRQIVWGIPIPAWFCNECDKSEAKLGVEAPECPSCSKKMQKDPDTFDTWFSSGQWPLFVTGYPNDEKNYNAYYPTDVMETGHDLIFKWVPRMVIFGLYLGGKAPFHTVYLHGLVNDAQGKKMSKSKGNVINPLDLTDKYGTDSLRMGLIVGNTPGTDLSLREDKIKGYKNFANKVWNIGRFVLSNTEKENVIGEMNEADKKLREEFDNFVKEISKEMDEYMYHVSAEKIYAYIWNRFASEILEESKIIFQGEDEDTKNSRKVFLRTTYRDTLKVLHPFMPFVTEELWSTSGFDGLLMTATWPKV